MLSLPAAILIVDDDVEIRDMLATLLTLEGFAVVTAPNGKAALTLARQHRPALIILDLMMPIMTGEGFRAAQLADDTIAGIPVLVLSARHDSCEVADRMQAVGCLGKPLDFDRLTSFVNTWATG